MTHRLELLFARYPVPGRVKTRLARSTSPEFAADLYAVCMGQVLQALGTHDLTLTLSVGTANITGVISGSGDFTKNGSGALLLRNNNQLTGNVTVRVSSLVVVTVSTTVSMADNLNIPVYCNLLMISTSL